ncbi:hypothetical protein HQ544_03470 [Candidatus Falkowbacteria bacterium]|nr:hypothetical protein [Candidatus Falkowbacteria bacterium]
MRFIKNTIWKDVFEGWKQREADDSGWINCATNIKGWPNWESWRKFTATQIGLNNLTWQIFKFTDPMKEIPDILIGPYGGWQSRVKNKNQGSFNDLLNNPEQFNFFKKHDKINSMINNFPYPTELIGLIREDSSKIVCIEGHHRATSIAMAKKQKISINFKGDITIALAKLEKDRVNILDKALERGTSKNPK